MSESFKKLKKKYLISALIKSVICGVSIGLIIVGAVLLVHKLSGNMLIPLFYVLISVVPAIICAGIMFLTMRPTDSKVAKKLDSEYGLNEKVQTSLEFKDRDGTIVEMQREDTEAKLSALNLHKPSFKRIWQYVVIGMLALSISLTAFIIPTKAEETPPPPIDDIEANKPFVMTNAQRLSLEELIENVKDSALIGDTKDNAVELLETLLAELSGEITKGEMYTAVKNAAHKIDDAIWADTTFAQIAGQLIKEEEDFGRIILSGGYAYRDHRFGDYSQIKKFYTDRSELVGGIIQVAYNAMRDELNPKEPTEVTNDEEFTEEKLIARLNEFSSSISEALVALEVSETDELYSLLNEFAKSIKEVTTFGEINSLLDDFENNLTYVLSQQTYYLAMDKFIITKLNSTFGVDYTMYAPGNVGSFEDGNNKPEQNQGGGYGPGNVLYGSDDLVYDPNTGEYVQYGELYNTYYAIVQEMLRNGIMTEEQAANIIAYFEILSRGIEEEE